MTIKAFAWFWMTLLALGVAGYAVTMSLFLEFRPSHVQHLFGQRPIATFAHFMGGAIALISGALQVNARLRARFLSAHRWLGRLYVVAVVLGGTAGLVLALQSFGGWVAHLGFGLLAVCWLVCTLNAYRHIRQGNVSAHRSWMIRSYALTLAAVTLRLYLPGSQIAGLSMTVAYPAIAWLCWVPNLLIAEGFVRARHSVTVMPNRAFGSKLLGDST
jgi:uncharacterized membrane protein